MLAIQLLISAISAAALSFNSVDALISVNIYSPELVAVGATAEPVAQ